MGFQLTEADEITYIAPGGRGSFSFREDEVEIVNSRGESVVIPRSHFYFLCSAIPTLMPAVITWDPDTAHDAVILGKLPA